MAETAGELEIVNAALVELGSDPLVSLSESTKKAATVRAQWPLIKRAVLRVHPWNCTSRVAVLSAALTTNQRTQSRRLPADFVRMGGVEPPIPYAIDGANLRTLATNETLTVYYYADVPPEQWDGLMQRFAVLSLAHAMAYTITASASLRDQLSAELERARKIATGADGSEQEIGEFLGTDAFLGARSA